MGNILWKKNDIFSQIRYAEQLSDGQIFCHSSGKLIITGGTDWKLCRESQNFQDVRTFVAVMDTNGVISRVRYFTEGYNMLPKEDEQGNIFIGSSTFMGKYDMALNEIWNIPDINKLLGDTIKVSGTDFCLDHNNNCYITGCDSHNNLFILKIKDNSVAVPNKKKHRKRVK